MQGDEPLIEPALIDAVRRRCSQRRADCVMSTAAHAIDERRRLRQPERRQGGARRRAAARSTSRARRSRGGATARPAALDPAPTAPPLRHIGLYAYRAGFLRRFPALPPSPLEAIEPLEQLRVLWHGERIAVHVQRTARPARASTRRRT